MPLRLPPLPRTDGEPRRAVTSVNLRHDDKALFDHLHTWWSLQEGRSLRQWDAFSILLAAALDNPRLQRPADLPRPPRR